MQTTQLKNKMYCTIICLIIIKIIFLNTCFEFKFWCHLVNIRKISIHNVIPLSKMTTAPPPKHVDVGHKWPGGGNRSMHYNWFVCTGNCWQCWTAPYNCAYMFSKQCYKRPYGDCYCLQWRLLLHQPGKQGCSWCHKNVYGGGEGLGPLNSVYYMFFIVKIGKRFHISEKWRAKRSGVMKNCFCSTTYIFWGDTQFSLSPWSIG